MLWLTYVSYLLLRHYAADARRRATLAAVYSSTLVHWVGDMSEDSADTWAFLDRRIENVMAVEKAKLKVRETLKDSPSLAALLARLRYPGESRMKP